jgi:SPP1 gp7 family putative phage head morphogenesis protein
MIVNAIKARIPAPKLPRSRIDPVMSAKLINKSFALIKRKYIGIETDVISLFRSLPVSKIESNEAETVEKVVRDTTEDFGYKYDVDSTRLALINNRLLEILDEWLLDGYELNLLWSGQIVEEAYLSGTGLAQSNLAAMSATYAVERSLSAILMSESYQRRIGIAYASSSSSWKGLSDWSRNDLANIISEAVAAGRNPKTVVTLISERLGVSRSHAENIAQTEITGALRQARWDEADIAKAELGLETGIFVTSALIPTTRRTHAARHGNVYTVQEQRDFYNRDGNRYRCLCANTEVILIKGKAELPKRITEAYSIEKAAWDSKYKGKK